MKKDAKPAARVSLDCSTISSAVEVTAKKGKGKKRMLSDSDDEYSDDEYSDPRVFDSLNYIENMKLGIDAVGQAGGDKFNKSVLNY